MVVVVHLSHVQLFATPLTRAYQAPLSTLMQSLLKLMSIESKTVMLSSHLILCCPLLLLWKQWQTIFLGSKITAGGDCIHEIQRRLLLGRKALTNLDSILKSRDITLLTKWEIDGETVETVPGFVFWGSKVTADGDCSHEIKRCLLLGRKALTNLDSVLESRDITLLTKQCLCFLICCLGWS